MLDWSGLIIVHVYFAIRPEKRFLTKSMIFGWIDRDKYLGHYDPARWPVREGASRGRARTLQASTGLDDVRPIISSRCATIEECYEFMLAYAGQGVAGEDGSQSGGQIRHYLTACGGGSFRNRGMLCRCGETGKPTAGRTLWRVWVVA